MLFPSDEMLDKETRFAWTSPIHPRPKKDKSDEYIKDTLLSGLYANIWCKWGKKELRTTNLAESFNRKLGVIIGCDHSDLRILVREFHHLNKEAQCTLRYIVNIKPSLKKETTPERFRKKGENR
ncbi:hypothetical protein Aduo_012532 [Ancylostoma duodenale]